MPSYAPLGQTDIANLAIQKAGGQPITDIDDTNAPAALACAAAFWQTVREVGRTHNWNCLKKRMNLTQLPPPVSSSGNTWIGWPGCQPATPPPYWLANTVYAGGTLVTYGEAIYYCLMGYTSTNNFINDMTGGYWAQLYSSFFSQAPGNAGRQYEWNFGYALPPDYLLLTELNGNDCMYGRGVGSLYEIYIVQTVNPDQSISNQLCLFTNAYYADAKYTAFISDPTIWDAMFIDAVIMLLASKISTQIRGDDGKMATELLSTFNNSTLPNAKLKDAGERKDRRYDPTLESNFLRSRNNSTNG